MHAFKILSVKRDIEKKLTELLQAGKLQIKEDGTPMFVSMDLINSELALMKQGLMLQDAIATLRQHETEIVLSATNSSGLVETSVLCMLFDTTHKRVLILPKKFCPGHLAVIERLTAQLGKGILTQKECNRHLQKNFASVAVCPACFSYNSNH